MKTTLHGLLGCFQGNQGFLGSTRLMILFSSCSNIDRLDWEFIAEVTSEKTGSFLSGSNIGVFIRFEGGRH